MRENRWEFFRTPMDRPFAVYDDCAASMIADSLEVYAVLQMAMNGDAPAGELLHDDVHHGTAAVMAHHARIVDKKNLLHAAGGLIGVQPFPIACGKVNTR